MKGDSVSKFETPKKLIEETFESIHDWLVTTIRKNDNITFPKEEFLERIKLFDEAEKLRVFNVVKFFAEREDYHMKFEEGRVLRGDEVVRAFGEIMGIDENLEEL